MRLVKKIEEARNFILKKCSSRPLFGIILGTGLSGLADHIEAEQTFLYDQIPHFPPNIGEDRGGSMILGRFGKKEVVVFQKRLHYYEGYSMQEIAFPVRLMKGLGVRVFITSNAAGGLNLKFSIGDIMIISDHINLMGDNPLIGPNEDDLGIRFPDMSEPYHPEFISLAEEIALRENIPLRKGVYLGLTGPHLETRAETRFLRMIGADAVGMSTIPEVIAAVHSDMKIFGLSVITNLNDPDHMEPVSFEGVVDLAGKAELRVMRLVKKVIENIDP